jgi:hypothetical protein
MTGRRALSSPGVEMGRFRQSSVSTLPSSLPIDIIPTRAGIFGRGAGAGSVWGAMGRFSGFSRTPAQGLAGRGGMKRPAPEVSAP